MTNPTLLFRKEGAAKECAARTWEWRPLLSLALVLLSMAGIARLFGAAEVDSQDFRVYWRAAHLWLRGEFPYRILASDLGFVFKYPPWMIPLFAPLGRMGYEFSKGVWAVLEILAIFYSVFWLRSNGVSRKVALWVTLLFWYIWLAHLYAGQLTLFLLAAALWAMADGKYRDLRISALGILFSAKIFSAYSLAGVWRRWRRPRVILYCAVFFLAMNAALLLRLRAGGHPLLEIWGGWLELYRGWIGAAASGSAELGAEVVRGTGNHGFTAAILRWIDPQAESLRLDLTISLLLAAVLGWTWTQVSRALSASERWAGWLAYGVIVHPLAWHHSFVLAFPLCAYSLEAASRSERKSNLFLALLGIASIGLLVPQVVGKDIVKPFELLGSKSWGVLICALALSRSRKTEASSP